MAPVRQSRRRFLVTLIVAAGAVLGAGRFLTPRMGRKKALLTIPSGEVPQEGALVYRESRVAIIREGSDLYALSLVCTHLACTVNVTPTELICPCHGSVYDRTGRVLKGPATRPLPRYRVERQGENLVVMA
jgi:cytochrome b6-f complex iron-sulfur subunit